MPIRIRLAVNILASLFVIITISTAAFWFIVNIGERAAHEDNLKNILYIIGLEEKGIEKITKDYGDWDDMLAWMDNRDPAFIKKQVTDFAPATFDLQFAFITDMKGNVVYQYGGYPEFRGNILTLPIVREGLKYKTVTGLMATARGPAMVSALPVEDSVDKKPQNGLILYGRLIDNDFAASLKQASGFDITFYAGDDPFASTVSGEARLTADLSQKLYAAGEKTIELRPPHVTIYSPLVDVSSGRVIAALKIERDRTALFLSAGAVLVVATVILIVVFFISWTFSAGLVGRLLTLQSAIALLEQGKYPAPLPAREADELGRLTNAFNNLIIELKDSREKLEADLVERTELFENSPISLWAEDLSELKRYFDSRRTAGADDFRAFFDAHPEELNKCAALIKVVNVNQATLDLFKAKSKDDFLAGLPAIIAEESYGVFKAGLVAIAEGKEEFSGEGTMLARTGEKLDVLVKLRVLPAGGGPNLRALFSVVNLTGLKRTEAELQKRVKELKEFSDLAAGRELKMEELEKTVKLLKQQIEDARSRQ